MPSQARVLRLLMDGVYLYSETVNTLAIVPATTGGAVPGTLIQNSDWQIRTNEEPAAGGVMYAFNRQYYDTEGYFQQEKTFFPRSAQVQDMSPNSTTGGMTVFDLFTVKPLSDEDLDRFSGIGHAGLTAPPGANASFHDLQDIIYAQWRTYSQSTEWAGSNISQSGSWGVMSPTARDRIFITRVVLPSMAEGTVSFIQPTAFVLGGSIDEEADYVHMERVRRDYAQPHTGRGSL